MAKVLLSGGLDSCVALFWAKEKFKNISAICFDYGQSHGVELECAEKLAKMVEAPLEIVNVKGVLKSTSPIIDKTKELETYDSYKQMKEKIGTDVETNFIPFRNKLFLTIAANRAEAENDFDLVTGIREADFTNFPDCREAYVKSEELSMCAGSQHQWAIHNPIIRRTRKETIELAKTLKWCWLGLAYTHTSYSPLFPPVIQDYATVSREEGFRELNLADPLLYRAYLEGYRNLEVFKEPRYQRLINKGGSIYDYAITIHDPYFGKLKGNESGYTIE